MDLVELLKRRESKMLVAFANTVGGTLLVGVEDMPMNARRIAIGALALLLILAACSVAPEGPGVPRAEAVESIVVMTKVPDGHPVVEHVEDRERIAAIVEFVTHELKNWRETTDGDEDAATTFAAFGGEGGEMLFHLAVGEDRVTAGVRAADPAGDRTAMVSPATAARLRSLLVSDGE